MSLSGVLDHKKVMGPRELQNWIHVRGLPKEMDWYDRLGSSCDRLLQLGQIHRVGTFVNVNKDWPRCTIGDGLRSGHECVGDGDDFIPRSNATRQKRQPERFRAAAKTNGVLRIVESGKVGFEFFNKRAPGKGAAINHLGNGAIKLVPMRRVMSVKIEKRDSNFHLLV